MRTAFTWLIHRLGMCWRRRRGSAAAVSTLVPAVALLLVGCRGPVGATQTSPALVYRQVNENVIGDGTPSPTTQSILFRFGQGDRFAEDPEATLGTLHQAAIDQGHRELLFALAELSYLVGNDVRRSVKPWEPRDARTYYLSASVYAWLYLFSGPEGSWPTPFDPHFRMACDLYNRALAWGLTARRSTNAAVLLEGGRHRWVGGELDVTLHQEGFPWPVSDFTSFVAADAFLVRGLSVRNRQPGLGAPLIAVTQPMKNTPYSRAAPATVILRVPGNLAELQPGPVSVSLELYSGFEEAAIRVNNRPVPLQTDLTAPIAYSLNQGSLWSLGRVQFLSSVEQIPTGIYPIRPPEKGKIPVVLVHGTFSSPVWWAEMLNTLTADPILRQKFQFWAFIYNSGNPAAYSAHRLRETLAAKIQELDPGGEDPALRRMVIVGHSQGGLLAKLATTETGDLLWQSISTNLLDKLRLSAKEERTVRDYLDLKPLPFVKRVVFICTPHRGSYQVSAFARRLARRFVRLPKRLLNQDQALLGVADRMGKVSEAEWATRTSLDSMSPRNRSLLALADIPLAPGVIGHSIVAVRGRGDYQNGSDGVVRYSSAHLDYVDSELVVRARHTCLSQPPVIEEVRRILHLHLAELPDGSAKNPIRPAALTLTDPNPQPRDAYEQPNRPPIQ